MQETNKIFLILFFNVILTIISFKIINIKNLISGILLLILLLIIISFVSFFYNALFLSLLFIIIYVGAVLVLFLFTIMLLGYKKDQNFEKKSWFFFIIFCLIIVFVLYLQKSQFFEYFFDKNLLYKYNLKIKQNLLNQTFLHINSLNFFEKIEKIGFIIFIETPQIILYSTIILLMGMIASINISKLNNKFLRVQQKEIQVKRKIKDTIKINNAY
jgi:NADH:ubiquinone oxidoreductase subunit 6 (subunit J)